MKSFKSTRIHDSIIGAILIPIISTIILTILGGFLLKQSKSSDIFLYLSVAGGLLALVALSVWISFRRISIGLDRDLGKIRQTLFDNRQNSEELQKSTEGLFGASSDQTNAVKESAAAIAEIRQMLLQTTAHAQACQKISSVVTSKTSEGWRIMSQMQSAMGEIEAANSQLQKVEDIILVIKEKTQVINDIVFKTQLLSFNASIEAARAGQYGRGFAVVAEEVGKLAQLSGDASRDIEVLLQDSQKSVGQIVDSVRGKVTEGKRVAVMATDRFGEISSDVVTISEKINQVSDATLEQESAIEETSKSIEKMERTAEMNRAAAKTISELSESLHRTFAKIGELIDNIFLAEKKIKKTNTSLPKRSARIEKEALSIAQRVVQKSGTLTQFPPQAKKISADDKSFTKRAT